MASRVGFFTAMEIDANAEMGGWQKTRLPNWLVMMTMVESSFLKGDDDAQFQISCGWMGFGGGALLTSKSHSPTLTRQPRAQILIAASTIIMPARHLTLHHPIRNLDITTDFKA